MADEITPKRIIEKTELKFSNPYSNKRFLVNEIDTYNNNFSLLHPVINKNITEELVLENEIIDDTKEEDEEEEEDEINVKDARRKMRDETLIKNFYNINPTKKRSFRKLSKPPISDTLNINWEIPSMCNGRIDAVWLWVNGSDLSWLRNYKQYNNAIKLNYYREYNTLLYSIRSVYMYAPYIKNYHILTANQVPSFLKAPLGETSFKLIHENYTLEVVSHEQVFGSNELPTFNSDAIESVLHRIPNLSECFIYLNDDMLLARNAPASVWIAKPNDNTHKEQVRLFSHPTYMCPNKKRMKTVGWDRSLAFTNLLLNDVFNEEKTNPHPYLSHNCYFLEKSVLEKLEATFEKQYNWTRSHKTRNERSINVPYAYFLFKLHSNGSILTSEADWLYFDKLTERRIKNMMMFKNIDYLEPYCICLNDSFNKGKKQVDEEIGYVLSELEKRYFVRSPFEK